MTFSRGQDGRNFYINNKLIKSEIPNDKKMFINKNIFLCHSTNNLNWEMLTKNLVPFKKRIWG